MDFSLSSSLVGSAVLNTNPDKLALDLQFATDKTLTARKGPTPVFTRASTGRFVGSNGLIQSAAINAPRFDHDPVTGVCKGLLMEESRTNLLTDSNAFNNWSLSNSTVAASSVVNPEGSLSAWKVVEDSSLATHTATRSFTPVSGTTYTASVWLKSAENGFAFVGFSGGGFATTFISVNLSTGVVSTALGTPLGATSVAHSTGWWRVSFSLAATAALVSNIDIRLSRDGLWANRSYLGNGVNGIYCYGAQVEAGAFPTSYIPTTTASVVRSADVCSISGTDASSLISITEGSWNINFLTPGTAAGTYGNSACLMALAGDNSNRITAFQNSLGSISTEAISSSISRFQFSNTSTVNVAHKLAFAYKIGETSSHFVDNALPTSTASNVAFVMPTFTTLRIGSIQLGGGNYMNGTLSSFRYYKKRLSNVKLRALTV